MNDIEILEEFIKYFEAEATQRKYRRNISITVGEDDIEAIENLIQRNKELKEKNKKWEELYDEDQEYITQLNNKIFQLETDNKKLDKENQGLFEAYNFNDTNLFAKILKEYRKEILNSIPISKIKEKIERLKILAEKSDDETLIFCELDIRKNQIYLLQSLLGDDN